MPLKIKKTVKQMVEEADSQIETLPLADAISLHGQSGVTFIDIRDPRELWRDGMIPGAINVTRGMLEMWLTVNGERVQNSTTANMVFDVPALVSYVSQFMTLLPGDVISTGTPAGVVPRYSCSSFAFPWWFSQR